MNALFTHKLCLTPFVRYAGYYYVGRIEKP